MIINGIENQFLEIQVQQYQYPQITEGKWDANWLQVQFKIQHPETQVESNVPCLLTFEVESWAEWMELLSTNPAKAKSSHWFTEPCLYVELLNEPNADIKHLRISFDLELKPEAYDRDDRAFYLDFHLDNHQLVALASDLRAELAKFPVRGDLEEEYEQDYEDYDD